MNFYSYFQRVHNNFVEYIEIYVVFACLQAFRSKIIVGRSVKVLNYITLK